MESVGGAPEVVQWGIKGSVFPCQGTHFLGDRCLGQWIRTDLGVRTFQGLGRNGPTREQVVRRVAKDLHTRYVLEDLLCDSHLQVPLHRKCLPECGPAMSHTWDIQTTFVYRLFPRFHGPDVLRLGLRSSRFPSGGGGGGSASFSRFASFSMLEDEDTSVRSTLDLGSRTLSIMRQFVADVEKDYEKESGTGVSELNAKESHQVKDTRTRSETCNTEQRCDHGITEAN